MCCSRKQELGGAPNLGARLNTHPLLKTENWPQYYFLYYYKVSVCLWQGLGGKHKTYFFIQEKNDHKSAVYVLLVVLIRQFTLEIEF